MVGKHVQKVCSICGKEETSGWSSHNQRKHKGSAKELKCNEFPLKPWCDNWFAHLSYEMQTRYADSNPNQENKPITDNTHEVKSLHSEESHSINYI